MDADAPVLEELDHGAQQHLRRQEQDCAQLEQVQEGQVLVEGAFERNTPVST